MPKVERTAEFCRGFLDDMLRHPDSETGAYCLDLVREVIEKVELKSVELASK